MHANARLTVWSRWDIVRRHLNGESQAEIARQLRVSRATVSKWWQRYLQAPDSEWFTDRSSRPRSCPHQTSPEVEAEIVTVRQAYKLGPARIGFRLGVPSSTVWKVLTRNQLNRLDSLDRPTGRQVRRYEKSRPGELIHVDTKQVARIPEGGGWWSHGLEHHNLAANRRKSRGYEHVHAAIDDHSRLAYVETLPDIKGETCAGFWQRAQQFFAEHGITVEAVMTDNWNGYRSGAFQTALGGIKHVRTRPYRPQTNGKVERFNRTLTEEWIYARPYLSENDRNNALAEWIHTYNHHRGHTAIGGPPITRVHNVGGSYT
jgi:transposase InsO family protein